MRRSAWYFKDVPIGHLLAQGESEKTSQKVTFKVKLNDSKDVGGYRKHLFIKRDACI